MNSYKSFAVLGLLGITQQAVSPGKNTNPAFPQYPAPPNTTTLSQSQALATAAHGGYQCIRANLFYAFPQQITSNVAAASTSLQTFYGTVVTQNGTPSTSNTLGNTDCCVLAGTETECPGVVYLVSTTKTFVSGRVIYPKATPGTLVSGFMTLTFKEDFVLAATYQDSAPASGTRGTEPNNYCDVQIKQFTKSTDTYTFSETSGLKGASKCTHFIKTDKAIGAPAFSLTKADWHVWQFQWAEFDDTAMATGGFLPKTSASPFFIGDYAENTYPNPIQAASPAANGYVMNTLTFAQEVDPSLRQAGDIGDLIYYSTFEGPYKETAKYTVPYGAIWDEYQYFQTRFDNYNTQKAAYDKLRIAYNEAVDYSKLRNSDIMRQAL